jgi:hypothetical protein
MQREDWRQQSFWALTTYLSPIWIAWRPESVSAYRQRDFRPFLTHSTKKGLSSFGVTTANIDHLTIA